MCIAVREMHTFHCDMKDHVSFYLHTKFKVRALKESGCFKSSLASFLYIYIGADFVQRSGFNVGGPRCSAAP